MNFEFATATRILFGPGTSNRAGAVAAELGRRALVVTGSSPDRAGPVIEQLHRDGVHTELFPAAGEPSISTVTDGVEAANGAGCDVVVGVGGGSALDAGKAIAALIANGGDLLDYLEVIGRGRPLARRSVPYIAIPTTAGTGSEVTRNAVLESPDYLVKVSLRSPLMLPTVAIVDPELTHSMPGPLTASTGLDALTQLVEPYVCNSPTPLTDCICREGIRTTGLSLWRAYQDGRDAAARESMSLASLFGGLALANARLGAVHGLAGTLGGRLGAPHGSICACLLPFVTEANIRALEQREPDSPALDRYREIAVLLTANPKSDCAQLVEYLYRLCEELKVISLSHLGLSRSDLPVIVAQSQKASSMRGNPIVLTAEELADILDKASAE
jgi:alcohol dehydrogenase class IV